MHIRRQLRVQHSQKILGQLFTGKKMFHHLYVVTSHTTSAGHLKWPGMRTAIGLAQYFALCSRSVLLSWLVSLYTMLEYALSTCLL